MNYKELEKELEFWDVENIAIKNAVGRSTRNQYSWPNRDRLVGSNGGLQAAVIKGSYHGLSTFFRF